jgi:hypothetical protein
VPICFPTATGVPFASEPPHWWDTTGSSVRALNDRVDDPRWRGATRLGFDGPWASAGGEEAGFRALSLPAGAGGFELFFSWTVKADNSQDPGADRVRVGLQTPGAAYLLQLEPFALVAGGGNFRPLRSALVFPVGAGALSPTPAWVGARGRVIAGATSWTVQLHVPVRSGGPEIDANGIQLANPFRFFFDIRVAISGGAQFTVTYPTGGVAGNPATWEVATIGGAGCGQGASIVASSLRTTNPSPHTIRYAAGPTPPVNTLAADVSNGTPTDIPAGTLNSRFWIANWGSIPNDPNAATNLWAEIPQPPPTAPNRATNLNPIGPGTSGPVTHDWIVVAPFLADFLAGSRWTHQCLLCEVSGGGIPFSPSSASSNFDIVAASQFSRAAQVSVHGLPDPGTPERDVYLLVRTTNMPDRVQSPRQVPHVAAARHGDDDGQVDPTATDYTGMDLLQRDHPTYVVHVFHDSGQIDPETGRRVLVPQTPFGYVVHHEGPLDGWEHDLAGPGMTEVGPGFYRIRVPTGGAAVVTTQITARERPRSWWKRLLRLLLALLRKLLAWIRARLGR